MKFQPNITFFNQLPLKFVLTIPFLIQVIGIVGIIGYLSFKNGQTTVQNLSSQLRRELTDRIEQQIQETIKRPHIINQINADAFSRNEVEVATGIGAHRFWRQAKIFPSTNLIYCATEDDGAFLGVGAAIDGTHDLHLQLSHAGTNQYIDYYDMDEQGERSHLHSRGNAAYEPRHRPWYVDAKQAQQATWSDIYLDFDTQLPTITASIPVYDRTTDQLMGVCATDMILSKELNDFLRDLEISPSGLAFVMEPSHLLIASSVAEPLTSDQGEEVTRLAATESRHPLIRNVTQSLIDQYTHLDQVESTQLDYVLNHQRHFLQIRRFRDPLGLDWIVVVVVPERDVMGHIYQSTLVTVVLSVIALLFTLIIGLVITRQVSQPLLYLSAMAKNIARGDWDNNVVINSSDAMGDLSRSFIIMAQKLQESFTTLEQKIAERTHELQQANQALTQMANTDELTKTANRRYFDQYLEQEWQSLSLDNAPLTLILCDVDHFKSYNDTYGHQEGDRCLQSIAHVLRTMVRQPDDLVARYGGEEFAIVLSNTTVEESIPIAQRIREMLHQRCLWPDSPMRRPVTLSMGIAMVYPSPVNTISDLIAVTDQALYKAKSQGRDCYVIHSS